MCLHHIPTKSILEISVRFLSLCTIIQCVTFKSAKIFITVKVKIYKQKLELSPCKRFLDPERCEPDSGVVVPALGDQLAQLPQQLRAVPPRRHLGPRARHAHHLIKEQIYVVSKLVKIFVREARKIFQEHEKYLRYSEADLPGACPRSWGHWAHTGSRAAGSRHTEQSAEEEVMMTSYKVVTLLCLQSGFSS